MFYSTPRRFALIVGSVALLTAVASTWPVAAHLGDHVVDGARLINPKNPDDWAAANIGADVLTTVWILNWDLHALVTQPLHLFDANIFYPAPLALARSEHIFATALLGVPGALIGGPIAAHQTALVLCILLNIVTAAYVVSRWTGSLVGGLVAGLLFGLNPFHQNGLFHIQRLGTFYYPLILLGLERFGATGAIGWLAFGGGALALQLLSGQYLAYYALAIWTLGGPIAIIAGRRTERPLRRLVRDALWLATVTACVALVVLPFALPYLHLNELGDLGEITDNSRHSMVFSSFLSLRGYISRDFFQPWARIVPATWLLVLVGIGALARDGRSGRVRVATLLAVGLFGACLSLGPRPFGFGLYELCEAILPGFRTAREPHRSSVLVYLAVCLAAGCGAAAVVERRPRIGLALVTALVALSLVAYWRAPTVLRAMPVGSQLPPVYRFLARCGAGDPLVELPAPGVVDNWRDAEREFFSIYHWLPLLNGRSGYSPAIMRETMPLANRLPDEHARQRLRALTGVRWVLVHCEVLQTRLFPAGALCTGTSWADTRLHEFGSTKLYDLGRAPILPRPWPPRREPPPDCDS